MKESLAYKLKILLKRNSITINDEELEFQLLSHPTYPSLHAVTGVLDHFAISNFALEVPKDTETLHQLPTSFLAFINEEDYSDFVLASKIDQSIQLTIDNNKKKVLSIDNFLEAWTGVVVIIDEDRQQVATDNHKKFFTNINIFIAIVAALTVVFVYKNSLFPTIHFLLSLVGLGICVLILYHELGINSRILGKICSEESKKTSCDAVLNSKGANLFGAFKLSDIGITYFASLILLWFFLKNGHDDYIAIALITLIALSITFYSIYYQFRVVKKWCPLCLSVVSVLWLQAFMLLHSNFRFDNVTLSVNSILTAAFCFLVTFAIWQFIAQKLKKEQELNVLKVDSYKFKRNYSIYKSLVGNLKPINTNIDETDEIVLSSSGETPQLRVVVITNPLCRFCKNSHELTEKLLKIKGKSIRIVIRFNVSEDLDSMDTRISLKLLEIYNAMGEQICLDSMHDIYGEMTPTNWLLKWGEPSSKYSGTIAKEKDWCKQHSINFTPEIIVNGKSFPKEYDRFDLLNFVDDIIEEEADRIDIQAPELNVVV